MLYPLNYITDRKVTHRSTEIRNRIGNRYHCSKYVILKTNFRIHICTCFFRVQNLLSSFTTFDGDILYRNI